MELQSFNPWWKSGRVSPEFSGRKRKIFGELREYIDKRQIKHWSIRAKIN